MIRPRWKKSISDLAAYRGRSLLVVIAIALGVWGLGSVLTSYVILEKDIGRNYLATRPASATLWTDGSLDDEVLAELEALPEIGDVEVRQSLRARMLVGEDTWQDMRLFVVRDFERLRLRTFSLESGRLPGDGELLIERDGWRLFDGALGESVSVRLKGGPRQTLRISGKVHDPGQPPSHMDHVVYGYIGLGTYESLVPDGVLDELLVSVSRAPFDREHIREVTRDLRDFLERRGLETVRVDVPTPGRHPHQGQLESLLFLQGAIGLLAFVLCAILIVNITSFLLARQVRQVGVMKAIGATPSQVVGMYYTSVACLGGLGALVGVPLGVLSGKAYAQFVATELNFTIFTTELPAWLYVALTGAAVLMPVVVATLPILRGTRLSVVEALADRGLGSARGWQEMSALSMLPRPVQLSIRAALRRGGRAVFTAGTLALGLTIFSIALNLRATLSHTLEQSASKQGFDVTVLLGRAYPVSRVATLLEEVDGIDEVAYWHGALGSIVHPDGTRSSAYPIVAPPVPTRLIEPVLLDGNWFDGPEPGAAVVNHALAEEEAITAGGALALRIGGETRELRIAGVVQEMGSPPTIYVPQRTLGNILGGQGESTTNLRIVASSTDAAAMRELGKRIERQLEAGELDVLSMVHKSEHLKLIEDHLIVITNFLLASSLLALLVAGLGLMSTMSIHIVERTREMGVMRAMGASLRTLRLLILSEGLVLGGLGLIAGQLLALPLSGLVSRFFGALIFRTPLELRISLASPPLSLLVMTLFVALATASAGLAISRISIREALAYE